MQDSANYFGFQFSRQEFGHQLDQLAKHFNSPQRVRILLNKLGEFEAESKDYQIQKKVFRICVAEKPINSNDKFFFHKTTQREIYPSIPAFDDILLYNENDELTEFTIGNLVVEIDGELYTPPISCGLLAGTFRAYLLKTGRVKERIIRKKDLSNCTKIFLVNSVRKWVEVDK
jgi:para-aminobenzoate synthetase/4-amino-4-deoxychorismate lyase